MTAVQEGNKYRDAMEMLRGRSVTISPNSETTTYGLIDVHSVEEVVVVLEAAGIAIQSVRGAFITLSRT